MPRSASSPVVFSYPLIQIECPFPFLCDVRKAFATRYFDGKSTRRTTGTGARMNTRPKTIKAARTSTLLTRCGSLFLATKTQLIVFLPNDVSLASRCPGVAAAAQIYSVPLHNEPRGVYRTSCDGYPLDTYSQKGSPIAATLIGSLGFNQGCMHRRAGEKG